MPPRVVLVVLDGLPHRHVGPLITPTLDGLARAGGRAPEGGRATLTAATYPNHATLVTGAHPGVHGITGNFVARDGTVAAADALGPSVPTLFDAATAAGLRSAAVYGDQHLVAVTAADRASAHWPPGGVVPDDATPSGDGYIADVTTVPMLVEALRGDADLVVAQLNDPDSAGHAHGPDSAEAHAVYRRTDAHLATVVEALEPRWDDTFVAIVSDHDQVTVTDTACIDLWSAARSAGLDVTVVPEGEAVVITGADPTAGAWLDEIEGIDGHEQWYDGARLAWAAPGRVLGWGECTLRGIHGGPASATTVAVVTGGHQYVRETAAVLGVRRPNAEDWAPTLATVLGIALPHATGRSLVGR